MVKINLKSVMYERISNTNVYYESKIHKNKIHLVYTRQLDQKQPFQCNFFLGTLSPFDHQLPHAQIEIVD